MPHQNEIAPCKPARKAAENTKPAVSYENAEPVDETNEKTCHSDGQDAPKKGKPGLTEPGGSQQPGYRMKRARFWQSDDKIEAL